MKREELSYTLTGQWLEESEKVIFDVYLKELGLDSHIWSIIEILFSSGDELNRPLILRAFDNGSLAGIIFLLECRKYGKSLFKNKWMWQTINNFNLPVYLWVRLGCCMDLISNPGFFVSSKKEKNILPEMIKYLSIRKMLTLVNDYSDRSYLYAGSSELPALPHALIKTKPLINLKNYIAQFKNLKRKIKTFNRKGGEVRILQSSSLKAYLERIKACFISTRETSLFYLPYQDLYNQLAIESSIKYLENVYFFIALINGEFVGYQAALKTGKHLNAVHGAFDRSRKSTYHAYEVLICKMVEFAIDHRLQAIDLGVVINHTKRRMINQSIPMSYFILSKNVLLKNLFLTFLYFSNIQSRKQLQFR